MKLRGLTIDPEIVTVNKVNNILRIPNWEWPKRESK